MTAGEGERGEVRKEKEPSVFQKEEARLKWLEFQEEEEEEDARRLLTKI